MAWRKRPRAPESVQNGPAEPAPHRPVYGDEGLRDQVTTAIVIAASSPEPRHLPGGPH